MVSTLECVYPRVNQAVNVHFDIVRRHNGIFVVRVGKEVTRILRTWADCNSLRLNLWDEKVSKGHKISVTNWKMILFTVWIEISVPLVQPRQAGFNWSRRT